MILMLALLATAPALTAGSEQVRYAALGDSFSAGTQVKPEEAYPVLLAEQFRKKKTPLAFSNFAVGGFTSAEIVSQELPGVLKFHPTLVTFLVGANDIMRRGSLQSYRANLKTVLLALKEAHVTHIYCISQPDWPHGEAAKHFGETSEVYFSEVVEANKILAEEAAQAGATYVDLFPLMQKQYSKKMYGPDGLHPTVAALAEWSKALWPMISEAP